MAMASRFVKVSFDFSTTEPGEISLHQNDIVQILEHIDENWLYGKVYGKEGSFPRNFVQPIVVPALEHGQKLFAAIKDFVAQEQGDLGFRKGDIIVGTSSVDHNWWNGSNGSHHGIFPITHVYELQVDVLPPRPKAQVTPPRGQSVTGAQESPSRDLGGGVLARARAVMDLTAQLDDELGFASGDMINITKVLDADTAIGECNGRTGSFFIDCVEVFEGKENLNRDCASNSDVKRRSKFDWWKDPDAFSKDSSANNTVAPPPVQTQSSSSSLGYDHSLPPEYSDCIGTTGYSSVPAEPQNNAASPSAHHQPQPSYPSVSSPVAAYSDNVQYPSDSSSQAGGLLSQYTDSLYVTGAAAESGDHSPQHNTPVSYNQTNTRSSFIDSGITPYGKTLFPFIAENPNELTFFDNEIVTLIRHVDDQWVEGEIDGKSGIFPSNYVEIIVDCPWADETVPPAENKPGAQPEEQPTELDVNMAEDVSQLPESLPELLEDVYGRVLYNFNAQIPEELNLCEGDTVTIRRWLDEEWLEAQHDDGTVGWCPVKFIEVISSDPASGPPSITASEHHPCDSKPSAPTVNGMVATSYTPPTNTEIRAQLNDSGQTPSPSTLNKPAITKPKPQLKPKPLVKPRPTPQSSDASTTKSVPLSAGSVPCPDQLAVRLQTNRTPSPTTQLQKSQSAPKRPFSVDSNSSLDDIVAKELKAAKETTGLQSVSSSENLKPPVPVQPQRPNPPNFAHRQNPNSPFYKPPAENVSVGHSSFYSGDRHGNKPAPKRAPPPRPTGPRPAPAPSKTPLQPQKVGVEIEAAPTPVPVPQRPAPPRPSQTPIHKDSSDLMNFSPTKEDESSQFGEPNCENTEVIMDLDNRIAEIQRDIEKYQTTKGELAQKMSAITDKSQLSEVQDELDFCDENIQGLKHELDQLRGNLHELAPQRAMQVMEAQRQAEARLKQVEEERKRKEAEKKFREELVAKRRETRTRIIEEIMQTERDYLQSLSLCCDVFLGTDAEKCALVDMEVMFGNIDEVIEVSQSLLNSLENCAVGKLFEEQIVGTSFVALKEDMIKIYAPYCRNHDDAIAIIEKYKSEPVTQEWLSHMLDRMRERASVFDLEAFLIKPVQRILKYPLLLNELIKNTEDDHEDKPHLVTAINAMTDVAAAINEFKRRKDLVLKYRKESEAKLSDKWSKFTVHSTKKKFFRLSQMMVGIQTVDENFNREEKKFRGLDQSVKSLVRDISQNLELTQESMSAQEMVANDISDFYADRSTSEVEKFCKAHNQLAEHVFQLFKARIEGEVIQPLNRLIVMFQGPHKVIKKRHDKLLDYDNASVRFKGFKEGEAQYKAAKDDLQKATNNYEAMNAQLLDELPKLFALSMEVVRQSLRKCMEIQKEFHNQALEEMYHMLELQLVLSDDNGSIVESFNIAHLALVEKLSDLSFIPKAFNPRIDDNQRRVARGRKSFDSKGPAVLGDASDHSSQSLSQKRYLHKKYASDRLFTVHTAYPGGLIMDLELPQDCLVGIIKEGDPMGNKERWYVDNGGTQGFVPKKFLSPASPATLSKLTAGSATSPSTQPPPKASNLELLSFVDSSSMNASYSASPHGAASLGEKPPLPADDWSSGFDSSAARRKEKMAGASSWESFGSDLDDTELPDVMTPSSPQDSTQTSVPARVDFQAQEYVPQDDLPPAYEQQQTYQAVYPFSARTPIEVSLEEGQVVHVLQSHDLDGNNDWWLVEIDGKQGYAPAAYLYKAQ